MQEYFTCEKCKFLVKTDGKFGTRNRNHCPNCLHSKHVDEKHPGDRNSQCKGIMEPIDIAFKKEKTDKYGNKKIGELMIVHQCRKCKKITKNRIAGDDNSEKIVKLCKNKEDLHEVKKQIYGETRNES
jgi:hypothetical protein